MMLGVECVDCGGIRTRVVKAGMDANGNRIRMRKCRDCSAAFTTVEAAHPFNFNRTDVVYADRARDQYQAAVGRRVEMKPYWSRDTLLINVEVIPGKRTNRCRKGLHRLEGDNVDVRPSGGRVCRECRRIAHRKWRLLNRDNVNAKRRARKLEQAA